MILTSGKSVSSSEVGCAVPKVSWWMNVLSYGAEHGYQIAVTTDNSTFSNAVVYPMHCDYCFSQKVHQLITLLLLFQYTPLNIYIHYLPVGQIYFYIFSLYAQRIAMEGEVVPHQINAYVTLVSSNFNPYTLSFSGLVV